MEVKKYNPFVVMNKSKSKPRVKPKPTGSTRERSSKAKPKPQTKLETGCLALENKKKLDIIYAKGFVKTSRK